MARSSREKPRLSWPPLYSADVSACTFFNPLKRQGKLFVYGSFHSTVCNLQLFSFFEFTRGRMRNATYLNDLCSETKVSSFTSYSLTFVLIRWQVTRLSPVFARSDGLSYSSGNEISHFRLKESPSK